MGYRLTREALRVIQTDEKGRVTYRRRYKKGQIVDTSEMKESRVDTFVANGILVDENAEPVQEDAAEEPEAEEAPEPSEDPEDPTDDPGDGDEPDPDADPDPEDPDKYDEMSYPDLQQQAKERTGNGAGSADDLRARLREQDVLEASE